MPHSAQFNKAQLHKLLTIYDLRQETIYGVVGRMKLLLEFFKQQPKYHGFIPFLVTYYFVTKAAAGKYLAKGRYFRGVKDYEMLDVYFASLYFKPMLLFLTEGKYSSPWQDYLHYCMRDNAKPFLKVILGINVHINADLYSALVHLGYSNEHDFFLVNDILQEVTPDVMHYLAFNEHDLVGITGFLFKDLTNVEFHSVIEKWRAEAWAHAKLTTGKNKKLLEERVYKETDAIGVELIKNFDEVVRIYKVDDILSGVNRLSVHI